MPIASQNLRKSNPLTPQEKCFSSSGSGHEESAADAPNRSLGESFSVLIVDRDSMSSDLLVNALIQEPRCEAAHVQPLELMRALATSEIDLVVISAEVETETGTGYDLAQTVGRRYPQLNIVILLHHSSRESVIRAFRSGARGVFSRHQSMAEFFDCVEHVRRGNIWASRNETDMLVDAFKSIPTFNLISTNYSATLTTRELQVVHCAAKGKTNRAIASELNLSEHTIKNYLFRAFEKLGVSSRVELLFFLNLQGNMTSEVANAEMSVSQNTA